MKELIVLYQSKSKQTWHLYHSEEQANDEYELMSEQDKHLEEKSRIWIEKTSEVIFYNV